VTQAADFVAKAQTQVGVVEVPDNKTIYGKFTGHDGQPWCGSFVMWCAAQIGFKGMPNCVYTPAGVTGFQGTGQWSNHETSKPQPGDIAFFSFDGKGTEHVGIVVKDNGDGTVTTIEGNTSNDSKPKGSQANGGEVAVKTRAYRAANKKKMVVFIVGFGRPKWTS
jgi:surface antigen